MNTSSSFQDVSSILSHPTYYPLKLNITRKPDIIPGLPDGVLALIAPIVAYWTYSSFFHFIDVYELAEKYRIHPSEEELKRNKVTVHEVVRDVILQHVIQTVVGLTVFYFDATQLTGFELYTMWQLKHNHLPSWVPNLVLYYGYMYGWSFLRLCVAFLVIDTWQYWLHRFMHVNKTLYRRFHSRHHRLYVPFAFGALYNDPLEGFLLDTLGSGIASIVAGLSHREQIVLYTFATLKTVDDHCGYRLPYDIFQIIFPNNSVYHDIHHQIWGIKNNFSQPFFTFWDVFNRTQYKFVNEYKDLQNHITLTKYKEFLAKKTRSGVRTEQEKENFKEETELTKETINELKKDI
ncbi:protein SUR2 [Lodderomyces elongisporus NRRL YB-4239]|uniref:Protein SUR2 n=1 Tax=Lodderomyces elongisporus (strain ATCC 11503 / CBS 2605 / JCM 1781 / NBRC 1676 / NRRL YB-4239) TaxID=379508 RepID=A5DTN4_LODEL|nr:protein SUR2 [Lodderomyces elongisporus NRRL YB-4239]